jgi:hypothetical protein
MATDRLLQTLLRSLQTYTDQQDTPRLLATAASLLVSLQNPLNIALLTGQLLIAPALWQHPDAQTVARLIGVFHSVSHSFVAQAEESPWHASEPDAWASAVAKGSDRAPTWKRTIALAGLLLGFRDEGSLAAGTRATLEREFVRSVNLGLAPPNELAGHCVTLALNGAFPMLPDSERALIDYDVSLAPCPPPADASGSASCDGASCLLLE